MTLGMGLGALEPLFRESKEEGDLLRAKRDAALAAAKAAATTPEQRSAGEAVRAYFTSERDVWAARPVDFRSHKLVLLGDTGVSRIHRAGE